MKIISKLESALLQVLCFVNQLINAAKHSFTQKNFRFTKRKYMLIFTTEKMLSLNIE